MLPSDKFVTMPLDTQPPRVQHDPGSLGTPPQCGGLPLHTCCDASTRATVLLDTTRQPSLAWLLLAASALLLRIISHLNVGVKMKPPRLKSYRTNVQARERKRSFRTAAHPHHKYAIFLPVVVMAMLFAGHLPDAADGEYARPLRDPIQKRQLSVTHLLPILFRLHPTNNAHILIILLHHNPLNPRKTMYKQILMFLFLVVAVIPMVAGAPHTTTTTTNNRGFLYDPLDASASAGAEGKPLF